MSYIGYIITALVGIGIGFAAGLTFAAAAIRNNKARAAKLEAELADITKIFRK